MQGRAYVTGHAIRRKHSRNANSWRIASSICSDLIFDRDSHELIFKIGYCDLELAFHSPDAADPKVTTRVMTIMLADEY